MLEKCGEKPRTFRNGLGLAIPAGDQVEILRRAVRYLIAAEGVKAKAKQLNLTDEQRGQLRERESTEQAAAESALLKLYTEVWLPRAEEGGIGIEKIAAGGRPLQTTLNDKKQAMIHERIVELITSVQPRVFTTLAPTKIVELFRLGEGTPPQLGISTGEVVDGFYSFLGFTRLMTSGVIRKAVGRACRTVTSVTSVGRSRRSRTEGKFQVAPTKVRFKVAVAEDEIDLESGFLMLPQAIPQPGPRPAPVRLASAGRRDRRANRRGCRSRHYHTWWLSDSARDDRRPSEAATGHGGRADLRRRPERPLHRLERHRQPRRHGGQGDGDHPRRIREGVRQGQASERRAGAAPRGGFDRVIDDRTTDNRDIVGAVPGANLHASIFDRSRRDTGGTDRQCDAGRIPLGERCTQPQPIDSYGTGRE